MEISATEQERIQREGLKAGAASFAGIAAQSVAGLDGSVSGLLNAATNIGSGIAVFAEGPVAVAAAAGTLAFGLMTGAITQAQAATKQEQADVEALTKSLESSGTAGVSGVAAIDAQLKKFSTTTDGSAQDITVLKKEANEAGVSFKDYADAMAGNVDKQQELYDSVQKQIPNLKAWSIAQDASKTVGSQATSEMQTRLIALEAISAALSGQNKELGESKDRVKDLGEALEASAAQAKADAAAQTAYSKATLDAFSDVGSQIAAQQQTLNDNAQSESEQTKKKVVADNVETAQSFVDTQNSELKTLESNTAAKIAIYEKFGKDATEIISDAGDNTSLLQSLAGASPTQVASILANYAQLGVLAGQGLKSGAETALKGGIPLKTILDSPDVTQLLKGIQDRLDAAKFSVPITSITLRPGKPVM